MVKKVRFYELLQYLYPAAFRAEFADEMRLVVAEKRRRASGLAGVLLFWLEVVTDALAGGLGAHWDLLRQDLRHTVRSLRRAPGFALTAVSVAALGIGVTTSVFTLADHALLRPLPFTDADRLVSVWEKLPSYSRQEASPANYRSWKTRSGAFSEMAAYHFQPVNLVGQGEPLRLQHVGVTGELFAMLGVPPVEGRYLDLDDDRDAAPPTAVISYGLWRSAFGGERVVGSVVQLDGVAHTIVGVMPAGFHFPARDVDIWTTERFVESSFEDRDNNYLRVLARLAPGVGIEEARAGMDLLASQLEEEYPDTNRDTGATVRYLRDEISSQARLLLLGLVGASICVLLIACTNLASLLIARGVERQRELSVRAVMGAGRERLVRQLLTESLTLALVGGAIGLLFATVWVPRLVRLVPSSLPVAAPSAVDMRVVLFALALTVMTGIGFGVVPAFRAQRRSAAAGLRGAGVGASGMGMGGAAGRSQRFRAVLVASQVAASVVLLTSSGLLMRALAAVRDQDPGFRTEDVLAVTTPLPWSDYQATERRGAFYDRVLSEVSRLPGVTSAAFTSFLPMEMGGGIWPVEVAGRVEAAETPHTASLRFVTPRFFATMGVPLRAGRDIDEGDEGSAPMVAVVSEAFARRYWPGAEPLGQRFELAFREREIVGVVSDIRVRGLERPSEPQVYLPYRQVPDGGLPFYTPKELVVRAEGPVEPLVGAIRRIVHQADPVLPIGKVRTLADVVRAETMPRQTQILVLGTFTALSLTLSGIGLYGLLAFAVSQRRSELGLRMALGAPRGAIAGLVLREAALLTAAGALLGGMLGYGAARGLEALLYGVRPDDVATYAGAGIVVAATGVLGSLLPALRAARVPPTQALKA